MDYNDYDPLTTEQREQVLLIFSLGMSYEQAGDYAGCPPEAILAEESRDPKFDEQLRHCELRSEVKCLKSLHEALKDVKNWRVAAWLLERLYPERYAKRKPDLVHRSEITLALHSVSQIILTRVPPELRPELESKLQELITSSSAAQRIEATDRTKEESHDPPNTTATSERSRDGHPQSEQSCSTS